MFGLFESNNEAPPLKPAKLPERQVQPVSDNKPPEMTPPVAERPVSVARESSGPEEPPTVPVIMNSLDREAQYQPGLDGKDGGGWRLVVRDTHTTDAHYLNGYPLHETASEFSPVKVYRTVEEAVAAAKVRNGPGAHLEGEFVTRDSSITAETIPSVAPTPEPPTPGQPNDLHSEAAKLAAEKQAQSPGA